MKLKLKENIAHGTKIHRKGAVVDLPDEVAKSLVARKLAEVPDAKPPADPPPKGKN